MNKLNVGDYVRTKNGTIAKIKSLFEKEDYIFLDVNNYICGKQNIIKSVTPNKRHGIIDLIEVGDYVNGIRIEEKYKNVDGNWVVGEDCGDSYYDAKFENEDIKTVVTKESFKNISYKIGE